MQLARRVEDGRQVRVIEWDANSSTDLSTVVVLVVVTVVCTGAVVGALQTTSWARALFVVIAVVSGPANARALGSCSILARWTDMQRSLLAWRRSPFRTTTSA